MSAGSREDNLNPERTSRDSTYTAIVDQLLVEPGVTLGPREPGKSRGTFGSAALRVDNKIFAMLSSKGAFVVKLPRDRVECITALGKGEQFDPGHGRVMKEWVSLAPETEDEWLDLAREAMLFVSWHQRAGGRESGRI